MAAPTLASQAPRSRIAPGQSGDERNEAEQREHD
jgi:hypothetical protein